jgi:hypothetical protein
MDLQARGRKSEYIAFIKKATQEAKSEERLQLNRFLTECFMHADTDFDGKVHLPTFNFLIDSAVVKPRHFGLIPSRAERYKSVEEMDQSRQQMFKEIDQKNHGYIRLHDWIEFFHRYFGSKFADLDPSTMKSRMTSSKEGFQAFLIAACSDRKSQEYKELYRFLMYVFQEGCPDAEGRVTAEHFDHMIELAAVPPRKFGYAPAAADMFKTDADRIASRKELFKTINTTGHGRISFDQWLDYSYAHICQKAKMLDPSLSGVPPPTVREAVRSI